MCEGETCADMCFDEYWSVFSPVLSCVVTVVYTALVEVSYLSVVQNSLLEVA